MSAGTRDVFARRIFASSSVVSLQDALEEYEAFTVHHPFESLSCALWDCAGLIRLELARRSDDHGPGCDGPYNCTCGAVL